MSGPSLAPDADPDPDWPTARARRLRGEESEPAAVPSAEGAGATGETPAERPARPVRHYALRALKRYPLGTPYPAIVEDVKRIVGTPPLLQTGEDESGRAYVRRPARAIDATGCGRPVADMFRAARLTARLFPVTITAGHAETFTQGTYHVAKVVLISAVQVLLQERRLQFAPKLPEAEVLIKEFREYKVRVTPAANETFSAREGAHDDVVLAVALACWLGERQRGELRLL